MQAINIIDISQEILSCQVYPGDPKPQGNKINSMEEGDLYNLMEFSMCAHNGTHIDTPSHFLRDGKTVEQMPLEYFVFNQYYFNDIAIYQSISKCSTGIVPDIGFWFDWFFG